MATFRKVHVQFWGDPFIQELTPEQKFFYLYLLTNDKTKQCGIYEITKRQICYDTGYNIDTVSKLLRYCIDTDKIRYNVETNELAIKNWNKYNGSTSPQVQTLVNHELRNVKDTVLIEYLYGKDNVEILARNKNKKENKNNKESEPILTDEEKRTLMIKKWEEMIVIEMMKIWKEKNPSYFVDTNNDYPSCLQIAYKIAEDKNIRQSDVVYKSESKVLESWKKIVDYIPSNSHYRKLDVTQICKQFGGLKQAMIADKNPLPPKDKKELVTAKEHQDNYVTEDDLKKYKKNV